VFHVVDIMLQIKQLKHISVISCNRWGSTLTLVWR